MFDRSDHPLMLAGAELVRFGLGNEALRLVETAEVPFATMLSSKSVLPELHPQFCRYLSGRVEQGNDTPAGRGFRLPVISRGLDTGMFSVNLDNRMMIFAGNNKVGIGSHYYDQIQLKDFIIRLTSKVQPRSYLASHPSESYRPRKSFIAEKSCVLTAHRLYECLNHYLDDRMVLLAEPGGAFCTAP